MKISYRIVEHGVGDQKYYQFHEATERTDHMFLPPSNVCYDPIVPTGESLESLHAEMRSLLCAFDYKILKMSDYEDDIMTAIYWDCLATGRSFELMVHRMMLEAKVTKKQAWDFIHEKLKFDYREK